MRTWDTATKAFCIHTPMAGYIKCTLIHRLAPSLQKSIINTCCVQWCPMIEVESKNLHNPLLGMTAPKEIVKVLPFGRIVQNAPNASENPSDPLTSSGGRRRSPRQRKYDKLQRQLGVASSGATYLDALAEHLGCGEGNELDFENLSEEEVSKIKEQNNSCMAIAQVAQEAIESNLLEAEYFNFEKILSAGPKQLITTPATTSSPAVLGKWGFYFNVLWTDGSNSDVAITDMFGCEEAIHLFYVAEYKRKQAQAEKRSLLTARQAGKTFGGKQPRKKKQ